MHGIFSKKSTARVSSRIYVSDQLRQGRWIIRRKPPQSGLTIGTREVSESISGDTGQDADEPAGFPGAGGLRD